MRALPAAIIYAGCLLVACSPGAQASSPVTYTFIATILTSKGGPSRNTHLPISITLDRDYPADRNPTNPNRLATYTGGSATPSGTSPITAVKVAGQNVQGWFDSVVIQRNIQGLSQISLQTALPQYGYTLRIWLNTTLRGVVKSVAIPKTIVPSNFQTASFSIYQSPLDSYGGTVK